MIGRCLAVPRASETLAPTDDVCDDMNTVAMLMFDGTAQTNAVRPYG